MVTADATAVGRARVSGLTDRQRSLAARLAVAGSLASADLQPPGLPPAAILIIDRLDASRQPLPLRPGGRVDPAWERATRAAVADLHRCAVHPIDSPPPAGCQAVLFRDEAELLACLALDASLGRASERWWWRAYLRRWGRLTPDVIAWLLVESPRSVPAALRLLAERDAVQHVLLRLTPSEVQQVMQAICAAFDAPHLAQALVTGGRHPLRTAPVLTDGQPGEPEHVPPPWQPFVPPQTRWSRMTPSSASLLGISMALAQAPAMARSVAFAQAVERWLSQQSAPPPVADQPETRGVAETLGAPSDAPPASADTSPVAATPDTPPESSESLAGASGSKLPTFRNAGNFDLGKATALPQTAQDEPQIIGRGPSEPKIAERDQDVANAPVASTVMLDGIDTELGGVLFLLNVMQRLDLPACFEPDWRLASRVGPWGVLELLGRGLLASSELSTFLKVDNSSADPLWAALAAIDGREPGELPGAALIVPERVHVPEGWLAWLDGEIASPGLAMTDGLLAGLGHGARCWLAGVVPLLRRMLERALGGEADAVAALLLRRGRLHVTSSHVDLVLPLDSVSLAVRRAGLDFDPGWLPDFGRVVRFHYER